MATFLLGLEAHTLPSNHSISLTLTRASLPPPLPLISSMSNLTTNIWLNAPDTVTESSLIHSPRLPPQSPKLQEVWSPHISSKDAMGNDTLAQARILAIFRSGRFPNKIDKPRALYEDLEQDTLDGQEPPRSLEEISHYENVGLGVRPDFVDEESYATEASFSSSASSSSSRSSPAPDWAPNWHHHLQAVLSSRLEGECVNACRALILSNEWSYDDLTELAYQLVSSVLMGIPPVAVTTCAVHIEHILSGTSQHEGASYFVSCISESTIAAWHHYWNPGMSFSIYPGRPFMVTQQHLDAAYNFCRLLGSLFKAKLVSRVSVKEIIDFALQNAVLLEHIDAIGNLLSYASSDCWAGAAISERDQFIIDLHELLGGLCEYHLLRPELVKEYEERVEEICAMVVKGSL